MAPIEVTPPEVSWGEWAVGPTTVMLVRCSGEMDRSNAYLLQAAVRDAVRATGSGGARVVVDLTAMTFAAAAVVDALVEATGEVAGERRAVAPVHIVIDGNRRLEMAARITDLHETFRLYEDVADAAAGGPELVVPGEVRDTREPPAEPHRGTTRRP